MRRWLPYVLVLVPALSSAAPESEPDEPDDPGPTEPDTEEPTEPEESTPEETEAPEAPEAVEPEPEPEPELALPIGDELTAADVAGAPLPGQESGLTVGPPDPDTTLRKVGRVLLFVPKALITILVIPVRFALWAYDRFHLYPVLRDLLFDDTMTYGVYPILQFDSQFGVNFGARFVHRNLFGEREHLSLRGGLGGRFSQLLALRLRSGDRFGERFTLEFGAIYEKRGKDLYYGIGDGDLVIPPRVFVRAFEEDPFLVRFRQRIAMLALVGDVRVVGDLHLRPAIAISDNQPGNSDDDNEPPIDVIYFPQTLVGFDGYSQFYSELEVRWDTRRAMDRWEAPSVRATGGLVSAFAGRLTGIDGVASFWRLGADLQRFVRIGRGPRVLIGRLYGEAVTGSLEEVPFNQLPRLGGRTLLRGYPIDRFRDRLVGMASLEYSWDLSRRLSASVFTDAGSVFRSIDQLDEGKLRVGFGVSIEIHSEDSFMMRASLASSIDGGVFVHVDFDPVFDLYSRLDRR